MRGGAQRLRQLALEGTCVTPAQEFDACMQVACACANNGLHTFDSAQTCVHMHTSSGLYQMYISRKICPEIWCFFMEGLACTIGQIKTFTLLLSFRLYGFFTLYGQGAFVAINE